MRYENGTRTRLKNGDVLAYEIATGHLTAYREAQDKPAETLFWSGRDNKRPIGKNMSKVQVQSIVSAIAESNNLVAVEHPHRKKDGYHFFLLKKSGRA